MTGQLHPDRPVDDLEQRLRRHYAALRPVLPVAVIRSARTAIQARPRPMPVWSRSLVAASVIALVGVGASLLVGLPSSGPLTPSASDFATATASPVPSGTPLPANEARYRAGQVLRVTGRDLGDPYEAYIGDRLFVIDVTTEGGETIYRLEGPSGAFIEDASYEDVSAALIERSTEPVDDPCPLVLDTVSELLRVHPFERARCFAGQDVTIRNVRVDGALVGIATLGMRGAGSMTPWPDPERGSLPFSLATGVAIPGPGWYTLVGRFGIEDESCGSITGHLRCRERFVVQAIAPGVSTNATLDGAWSRMRDAPIAGRGEYVALAIDSGTFIWGGSPEDTAAEGAIYDAERDAWTTIARAPGPDRLRTAAAWTGDEVLIWGGLGGDDGGLRYDPSTDRWSAIEPGPIAGGLALGAWAGDRFIVVNDRAQAATWDPRTGTWERVPDPPIPAGYTEGVWSGRELIVLGLTEGGNDPIVGAAFAPASGRWRVIAEPPYDGLALGTTPIWTGTEMLFAFHAYDPALDRWRILEMEGCDLYSGVAGVWTGRQVMSQTIAYDPTAGRCFTLPDAPARTGYPFPEEIRTHEFHTPAWNAGRLIVWSGFTGLDGPGANPDGVVFRPAEP